MSFCNKHKIFMKSYENVVASGEYCPDCEAEAKAEAKRLFPTPVAKSVNERKQQKENILICKHCLSESIVRTSHVKYCRKCANLYIQIFRNKIEVNKYLRKIILPQKIFKKRVPELIENFNNHYDELIQDDIKFLRVLESRLKILNKVDK